MHAHTRRSRRNSSNVFTDRFFCVYVHAFVWRDEDGNRATTKTAARTKKVHNVFGEWGDEEQKTNTKPSSAETAESSWSERTHSALIIMFILYAASHSIFVLLISFHLLDVYFFVHHFFFSFIYLQACAPRYVFHGTQPRKVVRVEPVGTCYLAKNNFTTYTEYSPCRTSKYTTRNAFTSARKCTNKNNCAHVDARRNPETEAIRKRSNSNAIIKFKLCDFVFCVC